MKKLIKSLLFILLLFVFISININTLASSADVYNIVTCPGEDMATQMQISWQSKTTITNLKVEYTTSSDQDFNSSTTINGEYRSFTRKNNEPFEGTIYVGFDTPRYVWNVLLTNLSPNTKYIYRITDGTKVYSGVYKFETGSLSDDEFSFLFITDPQYYDEDGAQIFNKFVERHITNDDIKFTLITGDISDKGGNSSYWDMFYTKSSIQKIPFAATVGNHDYYDSKTTRTDNFIFNHFFYNPQIGPEHVKGSSYYFVYNNALFIMLDSEEKYNTEEQKQWVRDVCASVDCSYIIVGCHKSAYAAGPYVSLGKTFIKEWGPVFDDCQVDIVLSGHDHVFTRTKNLINNEVTTEKYKGTVYIEGGAAGPKYYAIQSTENEDKWAAVVEKKRCATVITLGKKSYSTKTYSSSGTLLDSSVNDRKRFGEYDSSYTKEDFEQSFKIENPTNKLTRGTLKWDKKGYGHAKTITVTHENSNQTVGTVSLINDLTTSLSLNNYIWVGEINTYKLDILYSDKTTKTIYITHDTRIDWGSINDAKAINIQARTFTLLLSYNLNSDYDYIDKIVLLENGVVKKNFFISNEHSELNELEISLSNKLMEPLTTHTYEVRVVNVNGTIVWTKEITVTSTREITDEEAYQINMANVAFKTLIDNLLKALKQSEN